MPIDAKTVRRSVALGVLILGAGALVQANGGIVPTAHAQDTMTDTQYHNGKKGHKHKKQKETVQKAGHNFQRTPRHKRH